MFFAGAKEDQDDYLYIFASKTDVENNHEKYINMQLEGWVLENTNFSNMRLKIKKQTYLHNLFVKQQKVDQN